MNKFYSFDYIQYEDGQVKSSNAGYYYTGAGQYNIDEMKNAIRRSINDPSAVLTIQNIQEISKEQYEGLSGKPFPY